MGYRSIYKYSKLVVSFFFLILAKLHFRIYGWSIPFRPCISAIGYFHNLIGNEFKGKKKKKRLKALQSELHINDSRLLFIVLSFSEGNKWHSCGYGLSFFKNALYNIVHEFPPATFAKWFFKKSRISFYNDFDFKYK